MFKRCNAVGAVFGGNPKGRQLFSCISALLVAYIAVLNRTPRALILCENSYRRVCE